MNKFRTLIVGAAACGLISVANAQTSDYPARPIRVVVPFPAGGVIDVVGRILEEKLSSGFGRPVIIDNRPGAAGMVGAGIVAKSAPDGYTLLMTNSALTMGAPLYRELPFDASQAFTPLLIAAHAPSILVVHPSMNVKSVTELVELLTKSKRGAFSYGSAGVGAPSHLAAELFKRIVGFDAVHVPYKGAAPLMVDQIGGLFAFHFAVANVGVPQINAGKVRALAITSAERSSLFPDLPTMHEAGIREFEASQWVGYLAPRGVPTTVVNRFVAEVNKALAHEDVKKALARVAIDVAGSSDPASFAAFLQKDFAKWIGVVQDANIKAE